MAGGPPPSGPRSSSADASGSAVARIGLRGAPHRHRRGIGQILWQTATGLWSSRAASASDANGRSASGHAAPCSIRSRRSAAERHLPFILDFFRSRPSNSKQRLGSAGAAIPLRVDALRVQMGWRKKNGPRCDTWRLKRLCFLVLLLILNPVLSQLSWLSGRCTGLRRALRRSFCAVRVFPFYVALAAPRPVLRGFARFVLADHSRLASTHEQAAAPRQREQRVSATLSKVEETQRQSAETRCLRCRSGLGLLFPCAGGPGPHLVCRPAPLPLRRLSWQCRPAVCCGSRRALARTTATLDLAAESASLESPSSPHLRRAWNHRHLLALQSVAIVLPPGRAAAPDRDECSGGSCCRRGGPYWPERRGATCPAPAPAWNGYGGVRAT